MKEFINREKDQSCQMSLIFPCSEELPYLIWLVYDFSFHLFQCNLMKLRTSTLFADLFI